MNARPAKAAVNIRLRRIVVILPVLRAPRRPRSAARKPVMVWPAPIFLGGPGRMLVDDWAWRYGRRGRRSRPLLAPAACRCGCEGRRPLLPNQFCARYVAGVETIFFAEQRDDAGDTLDIVAIAGE